jgi:hypothetical protein
MLFMRPYQDGDHFEEIAPAPGKGLYFLALDGDKLAGWCRWHLTPEEVRIEEVEDGGDMQTFDGLVRGILAMANDQGIDRAVFSAAIRPDRLATSLIPVNRENVLISIDYFLNNCKKCKMF